jgi:DNA adenine methylase
MKPLLKWAGGKARLAARIDDAFGGSCSGTYYEPFCGSAAVFLFRRARSQVTDAVLSDRNPRLMNFHRTVRDDVEGLLSALDTLPGLGDASYRDRYQQVRTAFNDGQGPRALQAARLIWLNRTCFNGLYRENQRGEFNVPVGRYARPRLPHRDAFLAVSELLQGVEIVEAAFDEVIGVAGDRDQVYCDPPYIPITATANFTAYSGGGFDHGEQRALAHASQAAAARGALVLLSNHDLPDVCDELYPLQQGFEIVDRFTVPRPINSNASGRGRADEILCRIGRSP